MHKFAARIIAQSKIEALPKTLIAPTTQTDTSEETKLTEPTKLNKVSDETKWTKPTRNTDVGVKT